MSIPEQEFDRDEVERAFDNTLALQMQETWKQWLLPLTEDAV